MTMVPNISDVSEVYTGAAGVLASASVPRMLVDSSTIGPAAAAAVGEAVATRAAELGAPDTAFVDAPVSGAVPGATNATLTFMVGGDREDVARARPLLELMGTKIVHCGGLGAGQAAKLANNVALAMQMASIAEALTLGVRLGVDPATLTEIFDNSTSGCWSSRVNNPWPGVVEGSAASRGYQGGFAARLCAKDLGLAVVAGKGVGATLPMTARIEELYNGIAKDEELAGKDFAVYLKAIQAMANN